MKRFTAHTLSFLLLLTALACSPAKTYTKKGNKLVQAGVYDEASFSYMQALADDRTHVDARIGLRYSAQKAFNGYLDKFFRAHNESQLKDAVYSYRKADKFYKDVVFYGVELEFPTYYTAYYEEDLQAYLSDLYLKGSGLLGEKKFREAEQYFKEINILDPDYKDVDVLKTMSVVIPTYDAGLGYFEAGNYRKAYLNFDKVYGLRVNYKDVANLRKVSKERATITLAVMPFENASSYAYPITINSYIISDLAGANNEFIVVIDRENTEKLIKEQKLSLANNSNENLAVVAGELMGAKAILTGKVLDFGVQHPNMRHHERTGYESYQEKVYNPASKRMELQTRYRKVMYSEFQGESAVRLKIQYQLISTESGTVLASDVVEHNERDEIRYISYEGNKRNLVSGSWKSRNETLPTDKIYSSYGQQREVQRLLNAKRDFKPINEMMVSMQNRISNRIINQVIGYEMSRTQ